MVTPVSGDTGVPIPLFSNKKEKLKKEKIVDFYFLKNLGLNKVGSGLSY